jgi:hypothetical protein
MTETQGLYANTSLGFKTTGHNKHGAGHHHGGSSGAEGDYHLVQHEVLYSPLNNQVNKCFVTAGTWVHIHQTFL